MKRLHHMKESLMAEVQAQMNHLECVNTKELGEAIDMIKDLSEAIYYCTITEAMEEGSKWDKKEGVEYEEPYYYTPIPQEGMDNGHPRMYYGGKNRKMGYEHPVELRDHKEGQSPKSRKMYMESKELRHDKTVQIQELEQYMKELSSDIVEMIQGASPEEKQLLKSKLTTLISKIDHA